MRQVIYNDRTRTVENICERGFCSINIHFFIIMTLLKTKTKKSRDALRPYIGQFVLGLGWISDWEDIKDKKTMRFYIQQPTIKLPNKEEVYENLQTVSTEHHINLFISYEDMSDDGSEIEWSKIYGKYTQVSFCGYIEEYIRKDGSVDYGVRPTKQSHLHNDLLSLQNLLTKVLDTYAPKDASSLYMIETEIKPEIVRLEKELEVAGECLPTFYHTYSYYKKEIQDWKECMTTLTNFIRSIHSNRAMRRKYKVQNKSALLIPTFSFETNKFDYSKINNGSVKNNKKKSFATL